jgi:enoyl-CoA hydratase/carnithine racemase
MQRHRPSVLTDGFTEIRYGVEGGVATIVLDRPHRLNAFTHVMSGELVAACDQAEADDKVRAVIVTGSGRAFCAGADLDPAAGQFDTDIGDSDTEPPRDDGGVVALKFAAMLKPTIAAINGAAIGVGITMTLPMNIRIAAASSRIGFVFTRRALVPEAGSTWFLPRIVGIGRAMDWVTRGHTLDAEEARTGGLLSAVYPDGDLLPAARALASEIVQSTSPVAQAAAKRMLWGMLTAGNPWEAHRLESRVIAQMARSEDFAEGVDAFLHKRPPQFLLKPERDLPTDVPCWPDGYRHT